MALLNPLKVEHVARPTNGLIDDDLYPYLKDEGRRRLIPSGMRHVFCFYGIL